MNIDNIYCMDCLEGMRQMESGSVSLIIADPPYELQQHNGAGALLILSETLIIIKRKL